MLKKKKLKRYVFFHKKYWELYRKIIGCIVRISPTMVSKFQYWKCMGKKMDLKNPREFNEKLMWLKLYTYYKNPLVIECADKVKVRKYIKKCGCEELLIDCIGIYKDVKEIPWNKLPQSFVIKCNHGAGYNIVCTDKSELNIKACEKKLSKWLKEDFSLLYAEMQYHYIKPLIICEKYLRPSLGMLPDDYKVYCFYGKAECVMLCKEREKGHSKFYFFDREWHVLRWEVNTCNEDVSGIERPGCLEKLLLYAEKLSKNIPFVRIDFYVIDDKIYFGEMTFTPCGCLDKDYTEEGNKELSRRLHVPPLEGRQF